MHNRPIRQVLADLMSDAGIQGANQLARLTGVKQPTIHRILTGEIRDPRTDTIQPLATHFKVTVAQLRGEEPILAARERVESAYALSLPITGYTVPEISWVRAGELCDTEHQISPEYAVHWHPCPVDYKRELFALRVTGDSMDNGANGYQDGEVIFIDPTIEAHHNDDVIVRTPDGKTTFKRLQITPEGKHLLALNPHHPNRIIAVPEDTHICGVVVFSGRKRR